MNKKSLTCDVHFEDKDFQVLADSNYMNIVLRNLISNAIKFTSVGGTISVELIELKTQEYIVLKVKDNGIGMSEARINSLFEAAPQKSTKGTEGEHGTGLGMVLVKEILDAMNIEIQVESILKKGTSFTMKIPKSIKKNRSKN